MNNLTQINIVIPMAGVGSRFKNEGFKNIKPLIFGQHRCHSIYLSFGGDKIKLIDELLGRKSGCTKGMGGSASIYRMVYRIG